MKIKNILTTVIMAAVLFALSAWCIFGKTDDFSKSERRALAKFPEITAQSLLSGDFASDFEAYAVDRFPARDTWRSIKAYSRLGLFMQKDNNGLYQKDGQLSKLEYPMNTEMADHAIRRITHIKEKYLTDHPIYFAMIPDKNRYMAPLAMDYAGFADYMYEGLPFATPIRLDDLLEADDYYTTDTHWRQEKLTDVAARIAESMGVTLPEEYRQVTLDTPFYGVYVGQSALQVSPDRITYLTNPTIEGLQVEGANGVYDLPKAEGDDPYELFLSGNQPIITLHNHQNPSGRRLILFRDSFGSSLAPLLAQGYSETVLVDLRYVSGDMVGEFVDFENADVLFLYSTLILNNSLALK